MSPHVAAASPTGRSIEQGGKRRVRRQDGPTDFLGVECASYGRDVAMDDQIVIQQEVVPVNIHAAIHIRTQASEDQRPAEVPVPGQELQELGEEDLVAQRREGDVAEDADLAVLGASIRDSAERPVCRKAPALHGRRATRDQVDARSGRARPAGQCGGAGRP